MELDIDWLLNSGPPPRPPLLKASYEALIRALSLHLPTVQTVYRIEKNGLGPYTLNDNWKKDTHCPRTGRCTPGSDPGFKRAFVDLEPDERVRYDWFSHLKKNSTHDFLFGFSSLKQLHRWFHNHEELIELFKRGYQIKVYKNVLGFDSGSQVIFYTKK